MACNHGMVHGMFSVKLTLIRTQRSPRVWFLVPASFREISQVGMVDFHPINSHSQPFRVKPHPAVSILFRGQENLRSLYQTAFSKGTSLIEYIKRGFVRLAYAMRSG